MTGTARRRAPAAFRLDQLHDVAFEDEPANPPPVLAPVPRRPHRRPWGRLFLAALFGLLSFALGIWAVDAVTALFARKDWLGWAALVFAALAALGALGWLFRELAGLWRLRRIGHLRELSVLANENRIAALKFTDEIESLYIARPDLAAPRAELARHRNEIVDPADRMALAERLLMAPLDAEARRLVADAARRVSVVTAISPAAMVDLGFVAFAHVGLVRRLAELYGGRPGLFAMAGLMRRIVTHLAVTGGIAIGDGIIQQVLGHGLAARLSARLGEGVLNGILATRVGIAAIEVCRPMPFEVLPRPKVSELAASLTRGTGPAKIEDDEPAPI